MFCNCGAPTKIVNREIKCLKTGQIASKCDGIFHGNKFCRSLKKKSVIQNVDEEITKMRRSLIG